MIIHLISKLKSDLVWVFKLLSCFNVQWTTTWLVKINSMFKINCYPLRFARRSAGGSTAGWTTSSSTECTTTCEPVMTSNPPCVRAIEPNAPLVTTRNNVPNPRTGLPNPICDTISTRWSCVQNHKCLKWESSKITAFIPTLRIS